MPKGFADADKGEHANAEGDYLIWREILEQAVARKLPVVVVTNDQKEDWVRRDGSTVIGPHPLLVEEMAAVAGVRMTLLTGGDFLREASTALEADVSDQTLSEAKDASAADAYRPDLFYESMLGDSLTVEYKSRGNSFTRSGLQSLLGEDAPDVNPFRGPGGVLPKHVLAALMHRREVRHSIQRLQAEIAELRELSGKEPGSEWEQMLNSNIAALNEANHEHARIQTYLDNELEARRDRWRNVDEP